MLIFVVVVYTPKKCMCDGAKLEKKEVLAKTKSFWKKVFAIKNIRPNASILDLPVEIQVHIYYTMCITSGLS